MPCEFFLIEDDLMIGKALVRGLNDHAGHRTVDWLRNGVGDREALALSTIYTLVLDIGY